MPEHCEPKFFEAEREQLWNGPPIMQESDKPISFLARGAFAKGASPSASDDAPEDVVIEPRGLQFKYSERPERTYRARSKRNPEHDLIDPSAILLHQGRRFYQQNGTWFPYTGGDEEPECTVRRPDQLRKELAEPIPGLTKKSRGRSAPKAGPVLDPDRRHICPVKDCRKCFRRRAHLNRHIMTIHGHGYGINECDMPFCNFTACREDNLAKHANKHSHYQEIFLCTAEDDYKGIHLQNPRYVLPESEDIKPFKDLPIHPMALDYWRYLESKRRLGENIPYEPNDTVEHYFRAHPEEREPCLARDPRFDWRMPQAGPEFSPWSANSSSLVGKFKLAIHSDDTGEQEDGDSTRAGSSSDVQ